MTHPHNLAAGTCVICKRRYCDRPIVCDSDRAGLRHLLADILDLCVRLPGALQPGTAAGPRVSGTPEPRLPLNVEALDLSLPARAGSRALMSRGALGFDRDQVGTLSAATVLDTIARAWADTLDHGLPEPTVASLTAWLAGRVEEACDQHMAVDEDVKEIRGLRKDLQRVLAEDRVNEGFVVGQCPTVDVETGQPCHTRLVASAGVTVIECSRCYTRWPRERWLWLAALVRAA